jgi:multimeric flavodoxin WrbA
VSRETRPRLLVVWFSRTGGTRALADALIVGACDPEAGDVDVVVRRAPDATAGDVLAAQAVAIVTPTNFGYMSGMTKDFFDRVFLALYGQTNGLPWALVVKGSTDAQGTVASVERIVTGLRWRAVAPPLVVEGDVVDEHLAAAREIGQTLTAGLDAGMW